MKYFCWQSVFAIALVRVSVWGSHDLPSVEDGELSLCLSLSCLLVGYTALKALFFFATVERILVCLITFSLIFYKSNTCSL